MVTGTTTLQQGNDVDILAANNGGQTLFNNATNLLVDTVSVASMTITGITTSNDDVKLSVDGFLLINEAIDVGTGDLLLDVSGDVLQAEPITADGLGLMVDGKTTLQKFGNDVNTFAADNGGTTLFTDNDDLTVGIVTVDGMIVTGIQTTNDDAKLQTGGNLAVNSAIDLQNGDLFFAVTGNVTQTAPIMADGFGMMVSGNTTLNNSNNDVNTIAAENGGTTSFEDSDGYTVGTVSVDGMSVTGFPAPAIDFQGNVLFGPTLTGTSVTRTYTIENTGDAPMELIGAPVTVSGPNMDEFAIVSQPTGPIGVGQNVTFDVVFTPTTAGLRTATLSIGNNSDVNPLVFNVQGTGTSSLVNEKFDGPTMNATDNR